MSVYGTMQVSCTVEYGFLLFTSCGIYNEITRALPSEYHYTTLRIQWPMPIHLRKVVQLLLKAVDIERHQFDYYAMISA